MILYLKNLQIFFVCVENLCFNNFWFCSGHNCLHLIDENWNLKHINSNVIMGICVTETPIVKIFCRSFGFEFKSGYNGDKTGTIRPCEYDWEITDTICSKVCLDATKEEIFEASSVDLSITKTNGIFRIYVLPLFL